MKTTTDLEVIITIKNGSSIVEPVKRVGSLFTEILIVSNYKLQFVDQLQSEEEYIYLFIVK